MEIQKVRTETTGGAEKLQIRCWCTFRNYKLGSMLSLSSSHPSHSPSLCLTRMASPASSAKSWSDNSVDGGLGRSWLSTLLVLVVAPSWEQINPLTSVAIRMTSRDHVRHFAARQSVGRTVVDNPPSYMSILQYLTLVSKYRASHRIEV